MSTKQTVFVGSARQFDAIFEYVKQRLYGLYGPEEGEQRLQEVTLVQALRIYQQRVLH